jgi:GTPase SAR1 family protein
MRTYTSITKGWLVRHGSIFSFHRDLYIKLMGQVLTAPGASHPESTSIILVVGRDCAGKTSLLKHLQWGKVEEVVPCLGALIDILQLDERHATEFRTRGLAFSMVTMDLFYDYELQTRLPPALSAVMGGRQADAVVFVVDSHDTNGIDEGYTHKPRTSSAKDLLSAFLPFQMCGKPLVSPGCPVLILANKQDLPEAVAPEELIPRLNVQAVCEAGHHPWTVRGCSVTSVEGLKGWEEGMQFVLEEMAKRRGKGTGRG